MTFLDEVKKSLTSTGKQVAKKTKELTDTVQLKAQISAENEKIEKFCAEIGRKVFEKAEEQDEKRFAAEFEFIRDCITKRDELEKQLADLDGSVFCSECGEKIDKKAKFCSHCGAPAVKAEAAAAEKEEVLIEEVEKEDDAPAAEGETEE